MSPKLGKDDETRSHERFRPNRQIRFFLIDGSELKGVVEVKDVSESGLLFIGKDFVKKGVEIRLSVDAEKKGDDPIELIGRVAWVKTTTYVNGTYHVGLRFSDVTEEQKKVIRSMKKKKWLFGR